MARARNIKPGVMQNEDLADLSPLTRLLFVYLWMLADREGRLEDRPKRIKVEALPYDDANVDEMLYDLGAKGFLLRYEVEGVRYIQILNFTKHQRPHSNESKSEIPVFEPGNHIVHEGTSRHGEQRGEPRDKSLRPDSLILRSSDSLIPLENPKDLNPSPTKPAKKPASLVGLENRRAARSKPEAPTAATWQAYADAYLDRYNVAPVRNATVNGQLAQLVGRIGGEEAPHVARYYVGHNAALYVRAGHATGLLVRDAEKLRTEWATNRQTTEAGARQLDATQTNANAFLPLIEEARRREALEAEERGNHAD